MKRSPEISVSVIVPVCNVAQYLRKALDSLAKQTCRDLEVILVDDGSTDDSLAILKEYEQKYPAFHVIAQKNCGTPAARNRGLDAARGEYIGFADSDDWTEPELYEKLLLAARAENADIVQCSFFHEYPSPERTIPHDNSAQMEILRRSGGSFTGAEELLLDDGTLWNRLFRRSMLEKNSIRFDESMLYGEDVFFTWRAICCAEKIGIIPDRLYHYRRFRSGSQTNTGDRRVFFYFPVCRKFAEFVKQRGLGNLKPWCNHLFISYLAFGYERLDSNLKPEYFEKFCGFVRDHGYSVRSEIANPSVSGGFLQRCRYFVLKYLHPLTLRALLKHDMRSFERIIRFRVFLRNLPVRLSEWFPFLFPSGESEKRDPGNSAKG